MFRDDLEQREHTSPSNIAVGDRRVLSSRETAIFVSRFLTYPDGEDFVRDDDTRAAPALRRQQAALLIPGRESPGFRRFDPARGRASTGHYWRQFAEELSAYLRDQLDRESAPEMDELPDATQRLLRYVTLYEHEIRAQIFGDIDEPGLYVRRAAEERVLDAIDDKRSVVLIPGEAGAGKSSLLWSVTGRLRERRRLPVLVSATWLASENDRLSSTQELVDQLTIMADARLRPVLLLDTADLLLHSQGLIYETNELLRRLRSASVPVVLTVRPVEEKSLMLSGISARIELGGYDEDAELPQAVRALMRRYLPDHAAELGLELIHAVQTRGLPAVEILRSPLLLRLLFDLSEGTLPSLDLDVSGLYERYWHLRIVRDQRSARYADADDLSGIAARVGILMLADASPTVSAHRIETTLPRVALPIPLPHAPSHAISSLIRRGVLVTAGGDGWRFAHQTLFEFVAAKGLLVRGGETMLAKLLEHMRDHPHDLFTGAVLEQLVILMASEPSTRQHASEAARALLESASPSLREIGVMVWCHLPGLTVDDELILGLDKSAVSRLLRHLPQVRRLDSDTTCNLLAHIWSTHRQHVYRHLTSCLLRLVRRWPVDVARLVERLKLVEYLATRQTQTLNQPGPTIELTVGISSANPQYARAASLLLLSHLPDAAGCLQLLHEIAAHWSSLGDDDYLEQVVTCAVQSARRFKSARRDFGVAAGEVTYRHLEPIAREAPDGEEAWWLALAPRVIDEMFTAPLTVPRAAERHALGKHLCTSRNRAHITRILEPLFGRKAEDSPPQIVGSFLVEILKTDTLASHVVGDHLYDKLVEGLPARSNAGSTSAQRWAIMARAVLTDAEAPYELINRVTGDLLADQPLLWRLPEYLLGVLVPAALAGVARAVALVRDVIRDPDQLAAHYLSPEQGRAAQIELVQTGLNYAVRDDLAAEVVLSVALRTQRLGVVRALLAYPTGRAAIQSRQAQIGELIAAKMRGDDQDQRDASGLAKQLQAHEMIFPTVRDLGDQLMLLRDPMARAAIIEMFPRAVAARLDHATEALALIRTHVIDDVRTPASAEPVLSAPRHRLADAGFSAYRAVLALTGTREAWEPLWGLVREPPLQGQGKPDANPFRDIADYLRAIDITDADNAAFVAQQLVEVGRWVAANASSKQSKTISNFIISTARRLVRSPHLQTRRALIDAAPSLPITLGVAIVTAAVSTDDAEYVSKLINQGRLTGALADVALQRLKGHREAGFQPLPWLIVGL
ncbi:hypothetical protein [Microbacterium sp.]|uniref:hypothetical protein n=1 Tax=Microbacterium sp. TaxID=51671 RepID=UPI003C75FBBA